MKVGRAQLTDQIISELNSHKARTGIGQFALLSGRRNELPQGLNSATLGRWLDGKAKTARTDQLDYVLRLWRSLPDYQKPQTEGRRRQGEPKQGHVSLTPDVRLKLAGYRDRGFLPRAILTLPGRPPTGFSVAYVSRWMNGHAATARVEYLDFVLQRCAALEVHPQRPVVITDKFWKQLTRLKNQTGLGPKGLLDGADSIPEGLNAGLIAGWLNRQVKTARKDHWDAVTGLYEAHAKPD